METEEKVLPAACRECHRDQYPLHCVHLGEMVPKKGAVTAPKSLDYLKVKGGFSG